MVKKNNPGTQEKNASYYWQQVFTLCKYINK